MPHPSLPPHRGETITSGQLGGLLSLSERAINVRRLDRGLPVQGGGIDLAAVVRGPGGVQLRPMGSHLRSAAVLAPLPGETPAAAAARGLRRAMEGDDYFTPPAGWRWPDALKLAEGREVVTQADAKRAR